MAKEITKEELKKSLRHYWRMRRWAKKQKDTKTQLVFSVTMNRAIDECWGAYHCILCSTYITCYSINVCSSCPLHLNGYTCKYANSVWSKLAHSKTWKEWVINSTAMARVIMRLPREEE